MLEPHAIDDLIIIKKPAIGERARDTYRNWNIETTRFQHHLGTPPATTHVARLDVE